MTLIETIKQRLNFTEKEGVGSVEKTTFVTIELIQSQNVPIKFCSDFLVLYGLKGNTTVISGKKQYEIEPAGVLASNPFTHYSIQCPKESGIAVLHISQEMLQITGIHNHLTHIRCYVKDDSSGVYREYDHIRMYFARALKSYFENSKQSDIQLFTDVSQMLSILVTYFTASESSDHLQIQNNSDALERLNRIMIYIHEHWREPLSIIQLAQREYISSGYLSRSFKAYTGKTFTEYLMELRLQNAAHDLKNSTDTITKIAYANGFKDVNSFIKNFKAWYGITPKRYRKFSEKSDYLSWETFENVAEDDGVSNLLKYATIDEQIAALPPPMKTRQIKTCAYTKGQNLRHTWRKLLNVGYARNVLLAEVQNRICQAQREIGFEYIRFHGMLDDDMHVYYEDEQGQPYLDFSRVDMLLDFILSVDLKPYVELGYMPKLLAKEEKATFDFSSYISAFNDEEKWKFLIKGFLRHCIERYGRSLMIEWKFTTIGCNCVSTGIVSLEDYLSLYQTTYECVKETDKRFAFGGPGGHSFSIWDSHCIHDFFEYAISKNCVPDFVCTECFPHRAIEWDTDFWRFMLSQMSSPLALSSDMHYTRTMLKDYRKLLGKYGLAHLEIWIEEWNSTFWQRDLSGDTCYKAAWLTKNICENYDESEAFGYWTLSDFIEERSDFGTVYHGGYGLFTYNGIPKSGWLAMRLLHMLGDTKLDAGDGWMITRSKRGIQIILSHYCHYDSLYCLRYHQLKDPKQAYHVFVKDGLLKYEIHLTDLPAGTYEIKRFLVSSEHGSSFDVWLKMGMPQYLRRQEIEYLKQMAQPQYHVQTLELQGEYTMESCLSPHEIQIFLLEMVDQWDIS